MTYIGNLPPLTSRPGDETGHLWENYVIAERFKRNANPPMPPRAYFWRTKSGQEVDCLEEASGGMAAWEIRWNPRKARGSLPSAILAAYPGTPFEFMSRENMPTFLLAEDDRLSAMKA